MSSPVSVAMGRTGCKHTHTPRFRGRHISHAQNDRMATRGSAKPKRGRQRYVYGEVSGQAEQMKIFEEGLRSDELLKIGRMCSRSTNIVVDDGDFASIPS